MSNIEEKVLEINLRILTLHKYLKYAKDLEVKASIVNDILALEAKRDIWLTFLS